MSDEEESQSLRRFLNDVHRTGQIRVERDLGVSVDIGEEGVVLEMEEAVAGEDAVGEETQMRVGAPDGGQWMAEGRWLGPDRLKLTGLRSRQTGERALHYWRSSYRVELPESAEVELTRLRDDENLSAEPIDLSMGGIGLSVRGITTFDPGEAVEVRLRVADEFDETFPGRVAYSRLVDVEQKRMRVGIKMGEIDAETETQLQMLFNALMLLSLEETAD